MSKADAVTVIRPGGNAFMRLPPGEPIEVMVTAVNVRPDLHVTYEVVWLAGQSRNVCWVEACELSHDAPDRLRIGFGDK